MWVLSPHVRALLPAWAGLSSPNPLSWDKKKKTVVKGAEGEGRNKSGNTTKKDMRKSYQIRRSDYVNLILIYEALPA